MGVGVQQTPVHGHLALSPRPAAWPTRQHPAPTEPAWLAGPPAPQPTHAPRWPSVPEPKPPPPAPRRAPTLMRFFHRPGLFNVPPSQPEQRCGSQPGPPRRGSWFLSRLF